MPLYTYQAIDASGKRKKGFLEAHNERDARTHLREQGIIVKSLGPSSAESAKRSLKGELLMSFTLQLSQLIGAGIPLYESLVTLEEQYRNEPFHQVVLSLCEQIKAGSSLSNAMGNFPNSFDKLYRSMIAAGESVGALDVVLDRLTHLLSRQSKLKKQLVTAMIYPAILASFSMLIILLLLGFVIPSIEGIFEGRTLNGFTRFIISASYFARNFWWLYIPALGGMGAYLWIKLRSDKGKTWIQKTLLKLPVIKKVTIQTAVARFCRTLGTLQQGGLPIIESLRIARGVMHNVVLEREIEQAEARIIEGSSLSAELSRSKYIPVMISRMLAVGEDSGSSTAMLNRLADMYEDEVEKSLNQLMALAQPAILIFMGTVIGAILMAILLPLTDVSSLGF